PGGPLGRLAVGSAVGGAGDGTTSPRAADPGARGVRRRRPCGSRLGAAVRGVVGGPGGAGGRSGLRVSCGQRVREVPVTDGETVVSPGEKCASVDTGTAPWRRNTGAPTRPPSTTS